MPDAPLAARDCAAFGWAVRCGMPRPEWHTVSSRAVRACCSRRAAMNGAFISKQPLSADYNGQSESRAEASAVTGRTA